MTDAEIKDFLEANGHGSGRSFVAAARAIESEVLERAAKKLDDLAALADSTNTPAQRALSGGASAIRALKGTT